MNRWLRRGLILGGLTVGGAAVAVGLSDGPRPILEPQDDANDDPQWSEEQILASKFVYCGGKRRIGRNEIDIMK